MKEKSKEENMKALSIEEKAKAYDEALSVAQETYTTQPMYRDWLAKMFPELKENEDEKWIPKEIAEYLKEKGGFRSCWLAWLEKQGDITKLSEEEQNRFAKGVLSNCAMSFIDYLDAHNCEGKMCVSNGDCADIENAFHNDMWDKLHRYYCKYIEKQNKQILANSTKTCKDEQNPTDKIEPKFKVGDTIKCKYDDRQFTIKSVDLDKGTYTYTQEGCGNDIDYADENFELVEQNPADKVEPKFHEGEWVILTVGDLSTTLQIDKVDTDKKLYWFNDNSYLPVVDEECLHRWTIQDAKAGDVLASDNKNCPFIYRTKTVFGSPVAYCGVRSDGLFISESPKDHQWCLKSEVQPAPKEQRELLFQKMKEAGYEWDADTLELKKIKPIDEYEGLTDFERAVADACIGFIDKDLVGWKQYVKDSADDLLKIAVKKFHAVQDDSIQINPSEYINDIGGNGCYLKNTAHASAWSEEDAEMVEGLNNCLDELEEENGWKYVYVKDKNVELTEIRNWMKALKDRVQPQPKQEWSEDDEGICRAIINDIANDKSMCTFDISKEICDKKIKWLKSIKERVACEANCTTTKHWKPSEEQMEALDDFIYAKYPNIEKHGAVVKSLYQDLKKLSGK